MFCLLVFFLFAPIILGCRQLPSTGRLLGLLLDVARFVGDHRLLFAGAHLPRKERNGKKKKFDAR